MNMADVSRAEHAGPADAAPARWRVLPLNRSLGEHRAAWDRLNDEFFGSHPMLTADFVEGLLSHFGRGDEHLCVLSDGVGAKAMCVIHPEGRFRWATFLPSQAQVGLALLQGGAQVDGLLQALPGHVLAMDHMCVDPQVTDMLVSQPLTMRWHQALTMAVTLSGGFDTYWASRPDQLRKKMRRNESRIRDDGLEVRYVVHTSEADVAHAVDRYAVLESRGWKGQEGTALHPQNEQGAFYRSLLRNRAALGAAEVCEFWIGDRLAASRLVVHGARMSVILKTTYDEQFSRYAPGRLLLMHLIQDYFQRFPGRTIEFYTNASRDQSSWSTSLRPIRNIRQYRGSLAMLTLLGLRRLRDAARRATPSSDAVVTVHADVEQLPRPAKALLDHAARRHGPEASADWYDLQLRHIFRPPANGVFFVLSRGDEALAVLPMGSVHGVSNGVESLGNFYTSINPPAIAAGVQPAEMTALIRALRQQWPQATRFSFGPMDPEGFEFGLLRLALERAGLVPFRYFRFGRWSLPSSGLDYETYFAGRDGATRNTVLRMGRKFERQGGRLEIIEHGERVEAGLAAYEQVYDVSWKKAEPYPDFIRDLVRRCAAQGWLRLGVAWLGEVPVAAQIWIVAHGRAAIFKLAYDEQHKALSAGSLLTCALMRHALDVDHVDEVDYLMGDDAYKRNWMSRRDERWGIVAFDPLTLGGFAGLVRQTLSNARRHLRRKD